MSPTDFLRRLGLSEKEASAYLIGLQHGPVLASELASLCNTTRPNIYDVIHRLEQRGLSKRIAGSKGTKVSMVSPEVLQTLLLEQKKDLEELSTGFSGTLKTLQAYQLHNEQQVTPKVYYFYGKPGMKQLFQDSLHCTSKKISMIIPEQQAIESLGTAYAKYYVAERAKRNIVIRALRSKQGESRDQFFQSHKEQKREVRYLPSQMKLQTTVFLYDDKVAMMTTHREALGLLIQSDDYSETMLSLFEVLWSIAKGRK